jgi:hypothetical protein
LAALDAKLEKLADRDVVPEWLGDLSARVDRLAEAVELQLGDLAARMHALTERESAPAPVDGAILDPAGAVAEFGQQLADLAVRMDALGERADAIATAPVDPGLLEAIGAIAATQQTLMARLDELARTPGRSGTKPEVVLDLERTVRMVSERVMALSTAAEVRELYILSRLDSLLRAARVEVAEPAAVIDLD